MKAYGGVEVQIHVFLTWTLIGVSGQLHAPAALLPVERTRWIRGWLGLTAGLDEAEKKKRNCSYLDSNSDPSIV
jgi:hypothetical protein